jgi:hypothetical protein
VQRRDFRPVNDTVGFLLFCIVICSLTAGSNVMAQNSESAAPAAEAKTNLDVAENVEDTNEEEGAPDEGPGEADAPDETLTAPDESFGDGFLNADAKEAPKTENSASSVEDPVAPKAGAAVEPEKQIPVVLPSLEALEVLRAKDISRTRHILRRVARTANTPEKRILAIDILVRNDPMVATARICGRILRLDTDSMVRRKAAECLGRMPANRVLDQIPTLIAALDDENLDVVTMVGWSLANVGHPESLGVLAAFSNHPDNRIANHFVSFADRLRERHGLQYVEAEESDTYFEAETDLRRVPHVSEVSANLEILDTVARASWLMLYGGMSGWLHGGFLLASYGGNLGILAVLGSMTSGALGAAVGAGYGLFAPLDLKTTQQIVQLGTMGTLVGYGIGALSDLPPVQGLNMASYGFLGALAGTTLGVLSSHTMPATASALALGGAVGLGSSLSFGSMALSMNFDPVTTIGIAMVSGGLTGGLTTMLAAPYEIGLLPSLGMTIGGVAGALLMGSMVGMVESFQLIGQFDTTFTEGSGWALASGYFIGGLAGASAAMFAPPRWDPFLTSRLRLRAPAIGFVPDLMTPDRVSPVATVGGSF